MTRVTLKDVAKATGLTANSVSHALRDMNDISPETKEKIRRIAAEMGYVRNSSAASLRSGKTGIIGVVYDNLLNPYYSIMTNYLDASLLKNGYSFITFAEKHGNKIGKETIERLISHNVDGIISFLEPDENTIELFRDENSTPLLIIGRHLPYDFIDYIYTDDRAGGELATEHLVSRGYRNIAYMTDSTEISCAAERIDGYGSVVAKNGFEPFVLKVENESYSEATERLLNSYDADAIVCFNDMMAFEILYALKALSREDVAVVGYDDIQRELKFPTQITTIGYDKAQIADVAVAVLMYKIEEGKGSRSFTKVHGVSLVEGSTTAKK